MMKSVSGLAYLLCAALILAVGIFYYPKWEQPATEATISWDVSGYYMYLPAAFIYKDLKKVSFEDSLVKEYHFGNPDASFFHEPSGNRVMKYAAGQAVLMSPFFFIAHAVALQSDHFPADGFTYPYQIAIGLGMLFYALLGLFILRQVLLRYFPDRTVACTLVTIVFATNYLNYAAIDGAMTHNALFTIYACLLLFTINFYRKPSSGTALLIGLLTGLATLIRPTEVISLMIPLCWGLGSRQQIRERWQFLVRNYRYPLAVALVFLVVVSVQPVYWKWVSGSWIVYSYQDQGFDWLSPHFYNGLFSFRAGWLTYTPVMVLSLAGFIFLFRSNRQLFWPVFLFSLLFIYICFAWSIWWYGGSLGQRALIQAFPVLAFPLSALYRSAADAGRIVRGLLLVFVLTCIYYNLWLTHQAHRGGLARLNMTTRAYFWATLGRYETSEELEKLLDNPDRYKGEPVRKELIFEYDFDSDTSAWITEENAIAGKSAFLDTDNPYTAEINFKANPVRSGWLRASADFRAGQKEWDPWRMTQFVLRFYRGDQIVKENMVRVHRFLQDGETRNIYLDAKMPAREFDRVSVYFWNAGSDKRIIIDNLRVYLLQ